MTEDSNSRRTPVSIQTKILSTEVRNGMNYRREIWSMEGNDPVEMNAVYNAHGVYVGDVETADFLAERGILPEPRTDQSTVCSIGFSHKDRKWYGWSHRAIHGFGIGDTVEDGDCASESLPVGFEAKSLDDAKKIATAFADCVS
jgi:hypothetical protein